MHTVCLICDVRKPDARNGEQGADWCDGCGRLTRNREVSSDNTLIAPGSTLRYRDQRKLFENERET